MQVPSAARLGTADHEVSKMVDAETQSEQRAKKVGGRRREASRQGTVGEARSGKPDQRDQMGRIVRGGGRGQGDAGGALAVEEERAQVVAGEEGEAAARTQ